MARMLGEGAVVAFDDEPRTTVHARPGSISHGFPGPNRQRYVRVRADALRLAEGRGLLCGGDLEAAREALFGAIRWLYPYDRAAALDHYRRALPPRYAPPVSEMNTWPFVLACRLFGFDRAEWVRGTIRGGGSAEAPPATA